MEKGKDKGGETRTTMYFRANNGAQAARNMIKGRRMSETIFVGGGGEGYAQAQSLLLKYGNRHGLIAGATGTGKTVTLQILAEGFSQAGVPVFMADVKGDLSGLAAAGSAGDGANAIAFTKFFAQRTLGDSLGL